MPNLLSAGCIYYNAFSCAEQEAKSRKRKGLLNMSKNPFFSLENTNTFLRDNSLLEYYHISPGLL
jgi:hypothetical protein